MASGALPLVFLPSRSKASIIGMADWSPTRHSSGWSKASLVSTPWPFSRSLERAGELPRSLAEVSTRQKEIQYSSRTRASTDSFKRIQRLRRVTADLLDKLPEELRRSPEAALLRNVADRKVYNIVHLILPRQEL